MFFRFTALMQRVRRFCASGCGATKVLGFFSRLPRCMVGLEACAMAQYWARELGALGHEVRLMPAQYVKAYVKRNKNDAADAEAICEAVQRPTMRFVPVKTAEQQVLQVLAAQLEHIEAAIAALEKQLMAWHKTNAVSQRLASIPGIGPIIATAIATTVADPGVFRSGREFAAWLGLVPRQNSTGGKTRLGGITKRGNRYLRRLLINGASANLLRSKATKADPWVIGIRRRRPPLVVAVALANKTARIAWAVMLRKTEYQARAVAVQSAS